MRALMSDLDCLRKGLTHLRQENELTPIPKPGVRPAGDAKLHDPKG